MIDHPEAAGQLLTFRHSDQEPPSRRPMKRWQVAPSKDEMVPKTRRSKEPCRFVPTAVIDKSVLYRAGLIHILAGSRFRIVADLPSLGDLPDKLLNHKDAVLLLGLDKDTDGILPQLLQWRETHGHVRIVMLGEARSSERALAALEAGGSCYLAKDEVSPDVLLRSLELALLGAVVVSGELAGDMANRRAEPEIANVTYNPGGGQTAADGPAPTLEKPMATPGLSNRERLILSHLMRGASNKHIARDLGIAEATVKVHVKSLLRKIRVRNRTQAAMWGINHLEPAVDQGVRTSAS